MQGEEVREGVRVCVVPVLCLCVLVCVRARACHVCVFVVSVQCGLGC